MDNNTFYATVLVAFFTALPTIIASVAAVLEARRSTRKSDQALCQTIVNKEKSEHLERRIDNGMSHHQGGAV